MKTIKNNFSVILAMLLLGAVGCGGGGGDSKPPSGEPTSYKSITGSGVKGPLANAIVTAYSVDTSTATFKGAIIDVGTTDSGAQITGLALPVPLTPPYFLEFTSHTTTTDITTGLSPVITTLRTVLTQALLDTGEQVYATPLTTMATDIAIANADKGAPYSGNNNGTTSTQELLDALPVAASQVLSTVGFGVTGIDIWDTPPLIDSTTDTTESQTAVAKYRTAIEALTAVVFNMSVTAGGSATPESMFTELTADLGDGNIDGVISGTTSTIITTAELNTFTAANPENLIIPNTIPSVTVGEVVQEILVAEKSVTGALTPTTDLEDGTITVNPAPAVTDPDPDNDGVFGADDNCPDISNPDKEDTNNNGYGDPCDSSPTTVNDTHTVTEGGNLTGSSVLANDTDTEGDSLTALLASAPSQATDFTLNADGTFSYSHDGSEIITDSFSYLANDGSSNSLPATVTITINPVNDAPAANIDAITVIEGGTVSIINGGATSVLSNDTDVEDNSLTAVLDSGVTNGTLDLSSDGTFSYTHNGSETITDSFTYHANDGADDSNIVTVSIIVNSQNDAPIAITETVTVVEGNTVTVLDGGATSVLSNDTDEEGNSLTASLDTSTGNGLLTLSADGAFSYAHNGGETATDSFTYHANDGFSNSNIVTVNITITPDNDAPVAVSDSTSVVVAGTVTLLPGDVTSVLANDTDAEGNNLTAQLGVPPANAANFSLNTDGTFSYTHNGGSSTSDSFTYLASDGSDISDLATVFITITPNTAPEAVIDTMTVDEGGAITVLDDGTSNVLTNDIDTEGDILTAILDSNAINGALILNSDGTFTYTHNGSETTTDSFSYHANDGTSNSNITTVSITVTPQNDAPVATSDNASVTTGGTVTMLAGIVDNVLTNDSDAEADSLTAVLVDDVSHGTLTLNSNGTFSYTHDGTMNSIDSFTYQAFDGADLSDTIVVSISISSNPDVVGSWGFSRLKHRNSGSWASKSGTLTYNADGTGSSIWLENDSNTRISGTGNWTWSATINKDGSTTLIHTFPDFSLKTQRIVIADDGSIMIMDGTDAPGNQRFRVAIKLDPVRSHVTADLTGDYYTQEYLSTVIDVSSFELGAQSGIISSDAVGNLSAIFSGNYAGTISAGSDTGTYTISADGALSIIPSAGDPVPGYISGNGGLIVGARPASINKWNTLFGMKKADQVYATTDIEGSWAYMSFQDNNNGASYIAEFGNIICDTSGSCAINQKRQTDGNITIESFADPLVFSVLADGSLGATFGAATPAYAGAIGNGGNVLIINPSFEDTSLRQTIIAVRCSECGDLPTGAGPGLVQLTDDPANDSHAYWSPDGTQIVLASNRSGNNDIWVMNANGSSPVALTSDLANDNRPFWSPDGSQVVFHSTRTGNEDLWIINANGTGLAQLTTSLANDTHPTWSPDGSRIAFQSNRDGNNDIWTINSDGTGLTKLTTSNANEGHPMWKPDGTQITYARKKSGTNNIWVMNADGTAQQALTNSPADEQHADWSPDGTKIAYRSNIAGNYDVWVMDENGLNPQQITTMPSNDRNPDWSPDGSQIMFRSNRTGRNEIWVYSFPHIVTGTITLPASVTGQQWLVGVDTDLNGDNGITAFQQGTVTGNTFTYTLEVPVSGDFYVFGEVNVSGGESGPWEPGDFVGEVCGDRLAATHCTVNISADSIFNFSLTEMPAL